MEGAVASWATTKTACDERSYFEQAGAAIGAIARKAAPGNRDGYEAQIFGQGINFFHIENWYSIHSLIRTALKLSGLYRRGRENARRIQVRHNDLHFKTLPSDFNGFTLLHISDLHVDMNEGAMQCLADLFPG